MSAVRIGRRVFLAAGASILVAGAYREKWILRRALMRTRLIQPPANLLRNAGFSVSTNPPIPDYWGTDATARLGDLDGRVFTDDDAPHSGVKSICVRSDDPAGELTVQAHPTFVPRPVHYTLSAYVRSESETCRVKLELGWGEPAGEIVGREWRRIHVTYQPGAEAARGRALETKVTLVGKGKMRVSMPQLESGPTPTAFATALMDDHPSSELPWGPDEKWAPKNSDPAARAFSIDDRRRLMTAIALENPTAHALDDIARCGFDAVCLFVPASGSAEEFDRSSTDAARWMDEAARRRLRVIPFLVHARTQSANDLDATIERAIDRHKSHPAIVGWFVFDEPSRVWESVPWTTLAAVVRSARLADSTRPIIVNDNSIREVSSLLSASDVGSLDIYPIGQFANSLKPVADFSMTLNRAADSVGKPAAMWLQTYGYDDAVREPTSDEYRAMAYATFIHGTRLLCHWIYKPMSGRLWSSMQHVQLELKRLDRFVAEARYACISVGTERGRVHYTVWSDGSRGCLVACNIAPTRTLARVDSRILPSGAALTDAWYGSGLHAALGGRVYASLPAFGREVWEFRL